MSAPEPPPVQVIVSDGVLAKIAAYRAASTPGVRRLQPTPGRVAVRQVVRALERFARTGHHVGVDTSAVEIVHHPAGSVSVAIRLVATGSPPVVQAVAAVRADVEHDIEQLAGRTVAVTVRVIDVERD